MKKRITALLSLLLGGSLVLSFAGCAEKEKNGNENDLHVNVNVNATAEGIDKNDLPAIMQENMRQLNTQLAAYERLGEVVLYPTEFEKTPKRSIKRYLYETSLLNR